MVPLPKPPNSSSSTIGGGIGTGAQGGSHGDGNGSIRRQDGGTAAGVGAEEEPRRAVVPSQEAAVCRSPTPEDARALFGWAPPRTHEARPRDDAFMFSQASNNPWDEEEGRGAPERGSYGMWGNPYLGSQQQQEEEEEAVGEPSFAWGSAPSDSLFGAPRFGVETQESQALEPQAAGRGDGGGGGGGQQEAPVAAEQGEDERKGGLGGYTLLAAASGAHGEVLGYTFRCGSLTSRIEATSGAEEEQAVPRRQSGPASRKKSGAIIRVTKQGRGSRGAAQGEVGTPNGALPGAAAESAAAAASAAAAGPGAAGSGRSWGWTPLFCSAAQTGGLPVRLAKSLRRLRSDRLIAVGEGGANQPPEGLGSGVPEGSANADEGLPDIAGMGMVSLEGRPLLVRLDARGNLLVHTCSSSESEAFVNSDTAAAATAEARTPGIGAQTGRGKGDEQDAAAPLGRQPAGKKSPKGPRLLSLHRHRALVEGALRGGRPGALNPPTGISVASAAPLRKDAEAEAALHLAEELRVPLTMREAAVDLLDDVAAMAGGPSSGLLLRQGVLGGNAASSQQQQQQRRRKRPAVSVEERMRKFAAVQQGTSETPLGRAVAHLRALSSSSSTSQQQQQQQQEVLSRYQIKIPLLGVTPVIDSQQQQQQQGSQGATESGGGSQRVSLADRWARATVRKVPAPPADGTVLHSRQHSSGGAAAAAPSRIALVTVAMVAAAEHPGRTFPRRSSCDGTRKDLWAPSEEAQGLSRDLDLVWGGGGGTQPPPIREARPAALPSSSQAAAARVEQGRPRGDHGGSQQQQQPQGQRQQQQQQQGLSIPAAPRVKKRRKEGRSKSWVRPSQQSQGF